MHLKPAHLARTRARFEIDHLNSIDKKWTKSKSAPSRSGRQESPIVSSSPLQKAKSHYSPLSRLQMPAYPSLQISGFRNATLRKM